MDKALAVFFGTERIVAGLILLAQQVKKSVYVFLVHKITNPSIVGHVVFCAFPSSEKLRELEIVLFAVVVVVEYSSKIVCKDVEMG